MLHFGEMSFTVYGMFSLHMLQGGIMLAVWAFAHLVNYFAQPAHIPKITHIILPTGKIGTVIIITNNNLDLNLSKIHSPENCRN